MLVSARFRTYCHATEEEGRVRQALSFLSGIPVKEIKVTVNTGYHKNKILVLEARLRKGPKLTQFLQRMVEDGIIDRIEDEIELRLDDECFFYVRFDKQEAFQGRWVLDSGEDTIQVKAKVQAYPARPKKAAEAFRAQVDKMRKRIGRSVGK